MVKAIDSILYFITFGYFVLLIELNLSSDIIIYLILILILATYALAIYLLLKKIKTSSKSTGIYLDKFPKKKFFLMGSIILVLYLITNRMFGYYSANLITEERLETLDFVKIYGWYNMGLFISRLLAVIGLVAIFLIKLDKLKKIN